MFVIFLQILPYLQPLSSWQNLVSRSATLEPLCQLITRLLTAMVQRRSERLYFKPQNKFRHAIRDITYNLWYMILLISNKFNT
jgi:hypothetical protein